MCTNTEQSRRRVMRMIIISRRKERRHLRHILVFIYIMPQDRILFSSGSIFFACPEYEPVILFL
jgi:hypothetical protein